MDHIFPDYTDNDERRSNAIVGIACGALFWIIIGLAALAWWVA